MIFEFPSTLVDDVMNVRTVFQRGLQRAVCFLLVLAFVLPAFAQEAEEEARHMLWRVASADGTIEGYLVGSLHVMKEDAYPLDAVFDDAFSEADVLAFEVNLDSMQIKAQSLVRRLALYPPGKTLEGELSPETYALLEERAETLGMNLAQMQRLEPWMVSIMVPATQIQQAGYAQNRGIDKYFFDKAKEAGKPRRAFETAEEQLGFFDDLPSKKQEQYLRHSLEEADRTIENIDTMVRDWKAGNAAGIEELMVGQMQADAPELYELLIMERNEAWMPQLTDMLEGDKRPMIVVGTGHLVGEGGLVRLLEAQGYRLEQL